MARRTITPRDRLLFNELGWADKFTPMEELLRIKRRMERWSSDGLGPLVRSENPVDEEPHWRALGELSGNGTVADTTALRLARKGLPCRRYAEILRRQWHLDEPGALDDHDPYGTDEEQVFQIAEGLEAQLGEPPSGTLDRVFRASLRSVRRASGDDDNRLVAALSDVAATALGGLPIEGTIPLNGELWPHTSKDVKPWLLPPGVSPRRQEAALIEYGLHEVVAAIPVTEAMLRVISPDLSDDEVGDLAALLAPSEALYIRRQRAALEAWAKTGGAWHIDYSASTPQFAMAADAVRPDDSRDVAPQDVGTLVVGIRSPPNGERVEQLVMRRNPTHGKGGT